MVGDDNDGDDDGGDDWCRRWGFGKEYGIGRGIS